MILPLFYSFFTSVFSELVGYIVNVLRKSCVAHKKFRWKSFVCATKSTNWNGTLKLNDKSSDVSWSGTTTSWSSTWSLRSWLKKTTKTEIKEVIGSGAITEDSGPWYMEYTYRVHSTLSPVLRSVHHYIVAIGHCLVQNHFLWEPRDESIDRGMVSIIWRVAVREDTLCELGQFI